MCNSTLWTELASKLKINVAIYIGSIGMAQISLSLMHIILDRHPHVTKNKANRAAHLTVLQGAITRTPLNKGALEDEKAFEV